MFADVSELSEYTTYTLIAVCLCKWKHWWWCDVCCMVVVKGCWYWWRAEFWHRHGEGECEEAGEEEDCEKGWWKIFPNMAVVWTEKWLHGHQLAFHKLPDQSWTWSLFHVFKAGCFGCVFQIFVWNMSLTFITQTLPNTSTAAMNSKHHSGSGCTTEAEDSAQCETFDWKSGPSIDGLPK